MSFIGSTKNQKIIDNQQGHGNIINHENNVQETTPSKIHPINKSSVHQSDVPKQHMESQQLLKRHLHDNDPMHSGRNSDPTEQEENLRGINCSMRIPDQKQIQGYNDVRSKSRERNHNTWKSDNAKNLMMWDVNEAPTNPDKHRIRNHNTWNHTNKVQDDHTIGGNEGKNVYTNVNNIGNKSSTLLKSKKSKFDEVNTSICKSKNDFRDITPEKLNRKNTLIDRRYNLKSHITDVIPLEHNQGDQLSKQNSNSHKTKLEEFNKNNETMVKEHKNFNTSQKDWQNKINNQPNTKTQNSEETPNQKNQMNPTLSKKNKERSAFCYKENINRTDKMLTMRYDAEREMPLSLHKRAWE